MYKRCNGVGGKACNKEVVIEVRIVVKRKSGRGEACIKKLVGWGGVL